MNIGILLTGISFGQDRDFRHCFENINRNLIEPLSQDNNVFVYITTYDHEYINTLRDLYNPVKLEILNIHNTTQLTTRLHSLKLIKDESLDFVFIGRFDVHYFSKITEHSLDYSKFNFVCREGNDWWETRQYTCDTFYGFPMNMYDKVCESFLQLYDSQPDPSVGTHGLYPYITNNLGESGINFLYDDLQLSGHRFNSICRRNYVDNYRSKFEIVKEVLDRFT